MCGQIYGSIFPDQYHGRPIVGMGHFRSAFHELFQLGHAEGFGRAVPLTQEVIKIQADVHADLVVDIPLTGDDTAASGLPEGPGHAHDAFSFEVLAISTIAYRKKYQFCLQRQFIDLFDMEIAILGGLIPT